MSDPQYGISAAEWANMTTEERATFGDLMESHNSLSGGGSQDQRRKNALRMLESHKNKRMAIRGKYNDELAAKLGLTREEVEGFIEDSGKYGSLRSTTDLPGLDNLEGLTWIEAMERAGIEIPPEEAVFFDRTYEPEYKDTSTAEQAADARRFQEQCYLMDQWRFYTNHGKAMAYNNFVKVKDGDAQTFLTHVSTPLGCSELLRAKPHEISNAIPSIKLSKVYYQSEKDEGLEVPIHFGNFMDKGAIDGITQNKVFRGEEAGIKDFWWNLSGTNQFESERLVSARMTLFFQSIEVLDKTLPVPRIKGINKKQQESLESRIEDMGVRYLDLFHQQAKYKNNALCEGGSTRSFNEKYFRIKARVGWNCSDDHRLRKEIQSNTYEFFLSMIKHEINFQQDGSIEVVIHYQASIDAFFASGMSDVLKIGDTTTLERLKEEKRCLEKDLVSKGGYNNCATKGNSESRDAAVDDAADKAIKELADEKAKKIQDLKSGIYSKLLEKIYHEDKVFSTTIPSEMLGLWKKSMFGGWQQQSAKGAAANRDAHNKTDNHKASVDKAEPGAVTDAKKLADQSDAKKVSNNNSSVDSNTTGKSQFSATMDWFTGNGESNNKELSTQPVEKFNPYVTKINFIYLGQILDAALSVLSDNQKERNLETRHMVGEIQFDDPRTGYAQRVNIADIPISMNLFQMWFYRNCVEKELDSWNLKSFLNSIMNSLFLPSISKDCYTDDAFVQGQSKTPTMSMTPFRLPLLKDGTCALTGTKTADEFNKTASIIATRPFVGKTQEEVAEMTRTTPEKKLAQYLFLFATNITSSVDLTKMQKMAIGRKVIDEARGIYHFRLGQDRGLVKTIQFSKVDSPQITAMRIVDNPTDTGAIRELYDASISMIGNTLWKPGSLIFIDATSMSGGKIARDIGLGGYYMILDVESTVSVGMFETSLKCTWVSTGDKEPCVKDPINLVLPGDSGTTATSPPAASSNPKSKDCSKVGTWAGDPLRKRCEETNDGVIGATITGRSGNKNIR